MTARVDRVNLPTECANGACTNKAGEGRFSQLRISDDGLAESSFAVLLHLCRPCAAALEDLIRGPKVSTSSKGPHVHFEVAPNGVARLPDRWFTGGWVSDGGIR